MLQNRSNLSAMGPDEVELALRFRALANEISDIGQGSGFTIVPYQDESLPLFSLLPTFRKQSILRELTVLRDAAEATLTAGHSLRSKQLVWFGLKHLGLTPPSDMISFIDEDMVIEIHGMDMVQLFHNFQFFEYCSYTIEELRALPFPELYVRETEINSEIFTLIKNVFGGTVASRKDLNWTHRVYEARSAFRLKMDYRLLHSFGLKAESGQVLGMLSCERAVLVDPPRVHSEETMLLAHIGKQPLTPLD